MDLSLTDKVEKVPLVGPLKTALLKNLEIYTVSDLLHHYPFRYDDFSNSKKIAHVLFGETVTLKGNVDKIENVYTKSHRSLVKAAISDETGQIGVVWFNQPYLTKTLKPGSFVSLSGRVDEFKGKPSLISPEFELLNNPGVPSTIHTGGLIPVYSETAGVSSKWLRSRINFLLKSGQEFPDYFPENVLREQNLISRSLALNQIHFPKDLEQAQKARERLAFDEVFSLLLRSRGSRQKLEKEEANFSLKSGEYSGQLQKFTDSLPYRLTSDQSQAIREILADLEKPKPMNRILTGDVGSGKTVVAAAAAYITQLHGFKTFYMAPTEILASQHYETFKKLLEPFGVSIGLLTSSTRKNPKSQILIGTHALLHHLENSSQIGLVIIDEQHKFGVGQRTKLLEGTKIGSRAPHLLTMTATPIPRTLALTLLGGLDITFISQMPQGPRNVKTWVVPKTKRPAAYQWIKEQLTSQKTQAYVVCPFIEESQSETLKSVKAAKKEFELLKNIFAPLSVELLHGRMKSEQKEQIMRNFVENKTSVLVSTPVVEVGLDNPNAAIILIEGADRFGLASLHQLRGRVGRGHKPSFCLLFTESSGPEVEQRLKLLETNDSGLKLAEMDLKRRGGGQVYGRQQSGFIKTKAADLSDSVLITKVSVFLGELVNRRDPLLKSPALRALIGPESSVHMD